MSEHVHQFERSYGKYVYCTGTACDISVWDRVVQQDAALQPLRNELEEFCKWLEINGHEVGGHVGKRVDSCHYRCDACRRLTDARKILGENLKMSEHAKPNPILPDYLNDAGREMKFTVIDKLTGKEAVPETIALKEPWAKNLIYCDMEGFAIEEDGTLILLDECGRFEYCPEGRFEIRWENN